MVIIPGDANLKMQSITGAQIPGGNFLPWQPSTWPRAPLHFNPEFHQTLARIFKETMLDELRNVIGDIQKANPAVEYPLTKRGHVVAVACMCALDTIASYGYRVHRGDHVRAFIREHFPPQYKPFAKRIYPDYRLPLVHSWNLFGTGALLPGNDPITRRNGQILVGILNFVEGFETAVADFLTKLEKNRKMQQVALRRYRYVTGDRT